MEHEGVCQGGAQDQERYCSVMTEQSGPVCLVRSPDGQVVKFSWRKGLHGGRRSPWSWLVRLYDTQSERASNLWPGVICIILSLTSMETTCLAM
jgi:hypothetical protein